MSHTEKEIKNIAFKTMNDIEFDYDKDIGIDFIRFDSQHYILRGNDKEQPIQAWVVSFEFGKPYFSPEAVFLTISDEMGEPLYFQHSTAVIELEKDVNGKYHKKV